MNCPKCNHAQLSTNKECESCGVIFAKLHSQFQKQQSQPKEVSPDKNHETSESRSNLFSYLFYTEFAYNPFIVAGRAVVFTGMLIMGYRLITAPMASNMAGESFMHLINLPFHEAGHVFFQPFGSFLTSLGGSITQLAIPLICLFTLLFRTRDPFGASVCFWWFGENFLDMAPYINDARSLSLPLVGGNYGHSSPYGFHDWEYILTESGLLKYDHLIAKFAFAMGFIIMTIAVVWAGYLLLKQYNTLRS